VWPSSTTIEAAFLTRRHIAHLSVACTDMILYDSARLFIISYRKLSSATVQVARAVSYEGALWSQKPN
jgi:hypothetical protein